MRGAVNAVAASRRLGQTGSPWAKKPVTPVVTTRAESFAFESCEMDVTREPFCERGGGDVSSWSEGNFKVDFECEKGEEEKMEVSGDGLIRLLSVGMSENMLPIAEKRGLKVRFKQVKKGGEQKSERAKNRCPPFLLVLQVSKPPLFLSFIFKGYFLLVSIP